VIELYLFILLIVASVYHLWTIHIHTKEVELDAEDRRVAEVLLPIARLMNKLDEDAIADLFIEFNNNYTPDDFIIVVRSHAWKNGIKVCKKETELCYRLIRELPLNPEQEELLQAIEHLLEQVDGGVGGLIITSQVCDK